MPLRVVDLGMLEAGGVQGIVALPAIRADNAVRDDLAPDDGVQRGRGGVRDALLCKPCPRA